MDINAYISSGILESYVLGIASKEEQEEVEKLLHENQEIKNEVEAIRSSIESYAGLFQKAPPLALKNKIWDKISKEDWNEPYQNKEASAFNFKPYWIAASFILLGLSLLGNIFLFQNLQHKEQELLALQEKNEVLVQDYTSFQTNNSLLKEQLAILKKPGTVAVSLKAQPISPQSSLVVYWNKETKEVYITVNSLPGLPDGKQYQLWALKDGKPLDAGLLEINTKYDKLQKMKLVEEADAFAISMENAGGSDIPTTEAIYAVGSI